MPFKYYPFCGNFRLEPGELCDDGNRTDGDGCSAHCDFEEVVTRCGDNHLDEGEECDDGNTVSGDGCSAFCDIERGYCGDGVLQSALGEDCEPTLHDNSLPYRCSTTCRFIHPFCGDGSLNPGEECDDGTANSNLPGARCRPDCSRAQCGDSILDVYEECDDGNTLNGDGCDRNCMPENPSFTAVMIPFPIPVHPPVGKPGGPAAAIAVITAGAAAGMVWMRRRRK